MASWALSLEDTLGLFGAALAVAFALVVLTVGRGQRASRLLSVLLLVEAGIFVAFALSNLFGGYGGEEDSAGEILFVGLALALFGWLAWLYARFLAPLDTPLARPLRSPHVTRAILVVCVVLPTLVWVYGSTLAIAGRMPSEDDPAFAALAFGVFGFAIVAIYAFFVALSAWRRAVPGTAARRRAAAFAVAFGTRDLFFAVSIVSNFLLLDAFPDNRLVQGTAYLAPIGTLLYVPLLGYGILRTQLFDLDLKIKLGISRGTVAGIILAAVFALAKVVENYLNRTAGFVAGSIIAGVLLFLVPKLNKVGEKVANTAMPQVQPTSDYIAFKKLEVYKAALEAAHETGGITEKDRASLARLRTKLGLKEADASALEAEILSAPASS